MPKCHIVSVLSVEFRLPLLESQSMSFRPRVNSFNISVIPPPLFFLKHAKVKSYFWLCEIMVLVQTYSLSSQGHMDMSSDGELIYLMLEPRLYFYFFQITFIFILREVVAYCFVIIK